MDDPLEMEALENQHDEKLDAQLASVGMEQNRAKGEVLPCFQGKNSCRYNQAILEAGDTNEGTLEWRLRSTNKQWIEDGTHLEDFGEPKLDIESRE